MALVALPPLVAHGAGDVAALGLPLPLLLATAGGAVLGTAALLTQRSQRGIASPPLWRAPLPRGASRVLDAPATRGLLRGVGVTGAAALVGVAALGPDRGGSTGLGLALGVVVAVSLLAGPVGRLASPWRAVTDPLARWIDPVGAGSRPLPERLGIWPAAVALGLVLLLAEVAPRPNSLLLGLAAYAAVQVIAGLWFGPAWWGRGEGVEVASELLARVAPLGRGTAPPIGSSVSAAAGRAERPVELRPPVAGVLRMPVVPGLRPVLAVWLGAEAFHLANDEGWWVHTTATVPGLPRGLLGLVLGFGIAIAIAALLVRVATPRDFLVPALVPALAGWTAAHHLSALLLSAGLSPAVDTPRAAVVGSVQLGLLLAGHLVAVAAAHRMAVARFDVRAARAVQFPLRAVLTASAGLGALLLATG